MVFLFVVVHSPWSQSFQYHWFFIEQWSFDICPWTLLIVWLIWPFQHHWLIDFFYTKKLCELSSKGSSGFGPT